MSANLSSTQTTPIDRYHLCFALAKGYEDAKQYDLAFDYYAKGNRLKKAEINANNQYDNDKMLQSFARQQSYFSQAKVAQLSGYAETAADPIFIVGLPRAGSTLLEQILSSHSIVDGTMGLGHLGISTPSVHVKDSIATYLLKVVFSFYIFLTVAVTLFHMSAEYYSAKSEVADELVVVSETFLPTLVLLLWELDYPQLKPIVKGMTKFNIVEGIQL
jgi:hypothetical protein